MHPLWGLRERMSHLQAHRRLCLWHQTRGTGGYRYDAVDGRPRGLQPSQRGLFALWQVHRYLSREDSVGRAKIVKNSFDESELKLELADRTVTLTYDAETDSVEEKDRAKRKPKKEISLKKEDEEPEYKQLSLFDLPETYVDSKTESNQETALKPAVPKTKGYDKWADGIIVKNICNNKKYKVKHDNGNIIEVFDNDIGYLIMARADLRVIDEF